MNRFTTCIIGSMLLCSSLATADDNDIFNKIDTDKSGTISQEELLKADLVIKKQADGTDIVTLSKLVSDGGAAFMTMEQKKKLFNKLDVDKNGKIDRKEWSNCSKDGCIIWKSPDF